jgi:hypothetical protein
MSIINGVRHTSQEMDNSSFDETLGVNMVEIIGSDGNLKNPATSDNQDTLLTELQSKADLDEVQPVFDEGSNALLREILESTNTPVYYDPTTNSLKAVVTGAVTATVASTVVSGVTAIGGDPAAGGGPALTHIDWSTGVRNFLT